MKKYFWAYLFLTACATQNDPDGGPKDRIAPKPMEFYPANTSVNFTENQIAITFDEYFSLQNPKQTILISPLMDPAPKFTIKGKKLVIDLEAELLPNTTYNIYFADAIKDVNEGNDTSFSYVFSTGSFIDSSSIEAKIVDAYTGKPVSGAWLVAYRSSDSLIEYKRPDYVSKTNKEGRAIITYVPKGEYTVFALQDNNYDLMYSFPEEGLAFANHKITTDLDSATTLLRMFVAEDTVTRLLGTKYNHPGMIEMYFNREVNPTDLMISQQVFGNIVNDTIRVLTDPTAKTKGTGSFTYKLNDEVDTIQYYIPEDFKQEVVTIVRGFGSTIKSSEPISLKMSRPISAIQPVSVALMEDSVQLETQFGIDKDNHNVASIVADLKPGRKYTLKIEKGLFTTDYNQISDSLEIEFRTYADDYLGKVSISVTKEGNGIIELLLNGKVVRKTVGKEVVFEDLKPGSYQLRYIEDTNGDGIWTSGDYFKKTQPEHVYYFPESIELKSGWDIEQSWIID